MVVGTYGHGTHNDFVLVFDGEDKLTFTAEQVKRICDRSTGIGSDGLWITEMQMAQSQRCVATVFA